MGAEVGRCEHLQAVQVTPGFREVRSRGQEQMGPSFMRGIGILQPNSDHSVRAVANTKPLTILFVTSMHPSTAFPLRGFIVLRLATALRALGHRVELVELGVGHPLRYLLARPRVAAAIREKSPDVIHVHFGCSGLAVPRTSVPILTTFNGDDLTGTPDTRGRLSLKSRLGVLISQYVALRSARCIAVSKTLRERLWTNSLRAKTTVVRDAVDPSLFRPLQRDLARERLGMPKDEALIIFPHNAWEPRKRVWLAEAAVKVLSQWIPNARFWVVNGRGADEMPWYYAAADAMIVTSMFEGGPTATKEALSCGIPVVSVAVGDLELFQEAPTGLICADDTPLALASALREVLQRKPTERVSLLPDSVKLDEAARRISGLYQDVVARARGMSA
jgi:teichuronic acid biosynthesis glycosyltransferase TuaC